MGAHRSVSDAVREFVRGAWLGRAPVSVFGVGRRKKLAQGAMRWSVGLMGRTDSLAARTRLRCAPDTPATCHVSCVCASSFLHAASEDVTGAGVSGAHRRRVRAGRASRASHQANRPRIAPCASSSCAQPEGREPAPAQTTLRARTRAPRRNAAMRFHPSSAPITSAARNPRTLIPRTDRQRGRRVEMRRPGCAPVAACAYEKLGFVSGSHLHTSFRARSPSRTLSACDPCRALPASPRRALLCGSGRASPLRALHVGLRFRAEESWPWSNLAWWPSLRHTARRQVCSAIKRYIEACRPRSSRNLRLPVPHGR